MQPDPIRRPSRIGSLRTAAWQVARLGLAGAAVLVLGGGLLAAAGARGASDTVVIVAAALAAVSTAAGLLAGTPAEGAETGATPTEPEASPS